MELLKLKISVVSQTNEERKISDRLKGKPVGKDLTTLVNQTMKDRKSRWNGSED